MNRNVESHFTLTPSTLDMKRSVFDLSKDIKTTFNAGKLVPFYVNADVLPGDTFNLDMSVLCRMTPSVHPTMDNCYLETFFFFVPNRLVWNHWTEFCGENTSSYGIQSVEYSVPQITISENAGTGFEKGSVADYMGLPTYVKGISVSALPARAYVLIWNEWFRDQNMNVPCSFINTDSNVNYFGISSPYYTGALRGGALCPVNKYHDLFTSCLPYPQKSSDTLIPLGTTQAPLYGEVTTTTIGGVTTPTPFAGVLVDNTGMPMFTGMGESTTNLDDFTFYQYSDLTGKTYEDYLNKPLLGTQYNTGAGGDYVRVQGTSITDPRLGGAVNSLNLVAEVDGQGQPTGRYFVPHVFTDLSQTGATINQLRTAFQIQKFYEKQALYGSRYTEIVRSMFGVVSPDARLQRPEYLGGARVPINISQVVQTSSTDSTSPQANVAAYSLTHTKVNGFRKSFTEHGIILGLCCVRTDHTYQQGIPADFLRKTKFDYYWPVFSNLGNELLPNSMIYAQGSSVVNPNTGKAYDEEGFGYQEAWSTYRMSPNIVTGQFRSNATGTLDSWHYADNYNSLPTLTSDWLAETDVNVNRTLAVSSANADQFIADFYIKNKAYRVMPVYSIPGLIDHH